MFTLRCTQKLLARLKLRPEELKTQEALTPTTALGDWYAHLLLIERQHLVMLVSEPTRLCLLTTAKDPQRLPERFESTLFVALETLDIAPEAIERERREMQALRYGVTTGTAPGRSVLGSMNDYTNVLCYGDFLVKSLAEWNTYFLDWMCGPLDYKHPGDVARQRLLDKLLEPDASASSSR